MEEEAERRRRGRDELAAALKALREATQPRLTGKQAAELAGMSQPKISRIERGEVVPPPSEVTLLCQIYGATPARTAKLADLADSLHRKIEGAHAIMRAGAWNKQQQIAAVQAEALHIGVYQPVLIPGLLQSPGYARTVYALSLHGSKLERSLNALHQRQRILDDRTKRLTFVLSEAAVRVRLCDDEVMAEQIDHLLGLAHRTHIRLGVIPLDRRVREVPLTGFTLYDDRLVTVGMETATATLTSRDDLDHYLHLFSLMSEAADYDTHVHVRLTHLSQTYR